MNKTVNINLANTFFHIDEEAYNKLRRYLELIKNSFLGTAGSEEIIADIEARIAELFSEKLEHDRQVITQKEVDAVIKVMGQPEDYMVDEAIFEDEPRPKTGKGKGSSHAKKLYRDTETKYIGGVCAGLEHYLGFDALWIRLIFILFGLFTGFGLIAYILLWILVPEAVTTSQKLDMQGEPINISNIERKVKEGFDDVADKVKNIDYKEVGDKVKSSSKTFFDTIGDLFIFLFRTFGKFIGILLIIIGTTTLIGLFIGFVTVGVIDVVHFPGIDLYDIVNSTGTPVWVVSFLVFLAIGIPFFFALYLGLKILVNNLNSIGNVAKFTLLGVWLFSIGVLIALGIRQAASHAFTGTTTINKQFVATQQQDTFFIKMRSTEAIEYDQRFDFDDVAMVYDEDGQPLLYSEDIRFDIKKSTDSIFRLKVKKDADGSSFEEARERSSMIDYDYVFNGNQLLLNDYLTTDVSEKMRNQKVRNIVYIPERTLIKLDPTTKGYIGRNTKNDKDFYRNDIVDYVWVMGSDGELKCQNCLSNFESDDDGDGHIIINKDGVDINVEDGDESIQVKIDKNGVKIETKE